MRQSHGTTEVGLALLVAALVVGAMLGTGLAATNVLTSDGLSWVADDKTGTVVQVNPATGQTQTELKVAPPGNPLDIAQRDGLLVVHDGATGAITLIDVGTLLTTGQRATDPGASTKILLDAGQLYLVDRPSGKIHRIDPATGADVGQVWSAGTALADVALDGAGTVWALGVDGRLYALTWSSTAMALVEVGPTRRIDRAGPRSVLVPHEKGVTVFSPEGARITRVGTDRDVSLPAPQLADLVDAAPEAPTGLVPATVSSSATVVIVNGDRLVSVDVGQLGCPHPGNPVVYGGRVYVACLGSGKILVLDGDGHRAAPDITVPVGPGLGDPKLVLDDGQLIISVPGAPTGSVVDATGTVREVRTHDDGVPARDPAVRPPAVVPTPTPTPRHQPDQGSSTGTQSNPGSPGGGAKTTRPPTRSAPSSGPPAPPVNVAAQARPDGTILVSWQPQGQPDRYRVLRADTLAEVAAVPAGATSAIVTTLAPGVSVSFVVEAVFGAATARSAPSGAVRVFTSPAAPGGVTLTLVTEKLTELTISTRWAAASDNGSPITGYAVTISTNRGFQQTTQVGGLSTGSVRVTCGTSCDGIRVDATVHAINAAGNGQSGVGTYTYAAPPVPVITTFVCARIDGANMRCDVDFAGTATIRWALNGTPTGPGDVKNITFACGDSNFISVDVIVANVSGSDTESGSCQPTQS